MQSKLFWDTVAANRRRFGKLAIRPQQNSEYPDLIALVQARNDMSKFPKEIHPFEAEVKDWRLPINEIIATGDICNIKCTFVDTIALLDDLLADLLIQDEIAFDLEFSILNEGYNAPIICIMQFSTAEKDYIVDTLKLAGEMFRLKQILQNSSILKIGFGITQDLLALQYHYNIFAIGVIDLQVVHDCLFGGQLVDFQTAIDKWIPVQAEKQDKSIQLADFALRPLPYGMIKYARLDTRLAFQAYQNCKKTLFVALDEQPVSYMLFYSSHQSLLLKLKTLRTHKTSEQLISEWKPKYPELFKQLVEARDRICKTQDLNPEKLVTTQNLKKVTDNLDAKYWKNWHLMNREQVDEVEKIVSSYKISTTAIYEDISDDEQWEVVTTDKNQLQDMEWETSKYDTIVTPDDIGCMDNLSSHLDDSGLAIETETLPDLTVTVEQDDALIITIDPRESLDSRKMANYCFRCYDTTHPMSLCPYKDKKFRDDPLIKEEIKARKVLRKIEFPQDFKREKARLNQNRNRNRRLKAAQDQRRTNN